MDQPKLPEQAIIRYSRTRLNEHGDDLENTQFIQRHYQSRYTKDEPDMTPQWLSKPSAIIELIFPKLRNVHLLPYSTISTLSQDSQKDVILSRPRNQTQQNIPVRRRKVITIQANRSTLNAEDSATDYDGEPKGYQRKDRRETLDPRALKHGQREAEILNILRPLMGKESSGSISVLLCWGRPENCDILPVVLPTSADDVETWKEIRRAYYASRGHWRTLVPLFSVKEVKIVEVAITGRKCTSPKESSQKGFVGSHAIQDLTVRQKELEQNISDYDLQGSLCGYNRFTGEVECVMDCPSNFEDWATCPEQTLHLSRRELTRLKTRSSLTLAFCNPDVATGNSLLEEEGIINRDLDILRKLRSEHCPELRSLQFRGILVTEGWECNQYHILWPLIVTALFLAVVAAKCLYGDWDVAWNVGSFLIALVTLSWMWANHALHS